MVRSLIAVALSILLMALPAAAQDQGIGGSFITPFPDNDVYQVQIVGDWLADGLLGGLVQASDVGPGVTISRKRYDLAGLMRNSAPSDLAALEQTFGTDPSHIAIVMVGAQDRYSFNRRRATENNDEWRGEYAARVDQVMRALKKNNRAVYWVGLPNMRRWQDNERAQRMNDVIRERAYLNGVHYVDAYASFIDESGGYSDWGPDVTGKIRRLRDTDGVHFTDAGYLKLAHFVERELKRDIAQARTERSIPLAGDAAEQSRVNPEKVRLREEAARAQAQAKASKGGNVAAPAGSGVAADGSRDQKLETAKVDIRVPGAEGTEQVVTVEIVRPAIPASVVALVTRRQSNDKAAQMGDVLVDQIPGGLTVMSSITPARNADGSRRRMSPTQSPYFRVLEKGERLPPKPGRADDFTWPRPEATAAAAPGEPPAMVPGDGSTGSNRR